MTANAAGSPQVSPGFLGRFLVLRGATPELWLVFAIKFFNFAAYAMSTFALKLWLSHELGFSDRSAMVIITAWAVTMSCTVLMVGAFTDAIGLRRSFFVGIVVCLVARAVMVLAPVPWVAIAFGMFPLAVGEALGTPVLVASVRKYSTTAQRSMAFSIIYMVANIGNILALYLFDLIHVSVGEQGHVTIPGLGISVSVYRSMFLASFVLELLMVPLVWRLRPGVEVVDDQVQVVPPVVKARVAGWVGIFFGAVQDSLRETSRLFRLLVKQKQFYRLMLFLLLIAFLKVIFMQMTFLFAELGQRVLGPNAPVGKLWSINSWIIIFTVPVVGALTQLVTSYRMVVFGGLLAAGSVYIMTLPIEWFQGLAASSPMGWLGHGYLKLVGDIHPYYVMITLFVAICSIGEAFYSPRVYEYAASVAPKGQEASYSALSYVPILVAKIFGIYSGTLLATYCPATGEKHPEGFWLAIALIASVAPVGLILFRKWIQVPEAGRG